MNGFLGNIFVEILGAIIAFVGGVFWNKIPKSLQERKVRNTFGNPISSETICVCYGTLRDVRLHQNPPQNLGRFLKMYSSGRTVLINGPITNIVGDCEIRSYSYLSSIFRDAINGPIPILGDVDVIGKMSKTIIAIGSPSSNEVSEVVINSKDNAFYDFGQDQVNSTTFVLNKRTGKKIYGFKQANPKDYGIILKMPNPNFKNRFLVMCGGLGEYGTSGASWYYSKFWHELDVKYGPCFGILIEATIGADELAVVADESNL